MGGSHVINENFICLCCSCKYFSKNNIKTHTSLIILPDNLIQQWKLEISKHFHSNTPGESPLSYFVYEGVEVNDYFKQGMSLENLFPQNMCKFDIIFISLTLLRKEFYTTKYDDLQASSTRVLRHSTGLFINLLFIAYTS